MLCCVFCRTNVPRGALSRQEPQAVFLIKEEFRTQQVAHKKKNAVAAVAAQRVSNAEVDLRRPQNAIELTVKLQR